MRGPGDPPARILMTADTVGGVWTYALELAAGLAGRGTTTVLATMGRRATPDQRAAAARVPGLALVESDYRLEWMPGAGNDVARAGDWLLDVAARQSPDLVHVNGYAHAALPWPVPCLAVAHSCVLSWWQAVKGEPAPSEWDAYAAGVRAGLAAADAVVAPTASFLRTLETLYGPLPHARVIRNGRTARGFAPAAKEPLIFSAGRLWDEAKNLAALDDAAVGLAWPVVVAGEARHPDGGSAAAQAARWLGVLDEAAMRDWLARAAIFALPARYEPFGLAVLEAALSGCALVLGDIATLRELWDGAALFVPPDDPAALRAALAGLAEDPARRQALAAAARRRAGRYAAGRMVADTVDLYAELLDRAGPPVAAGQRPCPETAALPS